MGLGECDGNVIRAHTVSRGSNLSAIAEEGHVLHYTNDVAKMVKNGSKLTIEKVGLKNASVFNGFCSKHDRELFSCLENETFLGRADQCLAATFRTMTRELYGKDAASHLRETLRSGDKGLHPRQQALYQQMLEDADKGNAAARRELTATLVALTKAMSSGNTDSLGFVVLEFETDLPFMFAGAWTPFTDLYGGELQIGYLEALLQQVCFTSFATSEGTMICISWSDSMDAPGKIIAEQIRALPSEQQASVCLQIVTKHIENIFFKPSWFEALSDEQREQLDLLAFDGMDARGLVPSIPLRFDIGFGLPLAAKVIVS